MAHELHKEREPEEKEILPNEANLSQLNESNTIEECLVSILKVGLLCSKLITKGSDALKCSFEQSS